MGSVWRAVDLRLDRQVAVKVAAVSANSGTSTSQARRRLRREAEALAALSEPRIARVYDLVEADGEVCLVMELVDGESLETRLDRWPPLTPPEALAIAEQCAEALRAAHRIGIVHRDVKPSNIMLGPDGVKVVDFGIATHFGPASGLTTATMPRTVMGTAAYLAPERALGMQAEGAADFYSLGVVLYRMLAGHLPFRTEEIIAMLYAHTRTAPEPLPANVPAPAAALCLRLLSKRPEQRPTSAQEFRAASEALTRGHGHTRMRRREAFAAASVGLHTSPTTAPPTVVTATRPHQRTARAGRTDRRTGHRGIATLFAALSSGALVLTAMTAWNLLEQPAAAGTNSPAPAPKVATAPAAATSPSVGHVSARPVALPSTSVPKAPQHPSGGQQATHAKHGGNGNGNSDGGGDGGAGGD